MSQALERAELSRDSVAAVHAHMHQLARHVSLPFRRGTWRGRAGAWQGAGVGSSIDFRDHRPYLPGDDLRYLDWHAYARTDNYIMKLYQEEVSPYVDLVLDLSESMFFEPSKARRALELFYLALESAIRNQAVLRVVGIRGAELFELSKAQLYGHDLAQLLQGQDGSEAPELSTIQWRPQSLRVFISDLLFPVEPRKVLAPLTIQKGRAVVLAPYLQSEARPDWLGNTRFIDCEVGAAREEFITSDLLERYHSAYDLHFKCWRESCVLLQIPFARVEAEGALIDALRHEALIDGVLESWG